jgi:hypothetical protein
MEGPVAPWTTILGSKLTPPGYSTTWQDLEYWPVAQTRRPC